MTGWVKLEPAQFENVKTQKRIRGIDVDVYISPYDIPEAVRGYFDEDLDRFVIEFRYIEDERTEQHPQSEKVTLRLGKYSQRIYAIEIDVKALKAKAVSLNLNLLEDEVEGALNAFASESPSRMRETNYALTRDVIDQEKEEIFEPLIERLVPEQSPQP